MTRHALLVLVAATFAACTRTHTVHESDGARPDGGTSRIDAGTRDAGPPIGRECAEAAPVDVLFVIDNSNDMAEQISDLAARFPAFVRALLEPPDRDDDGEPDWLPVTDLHLGVVTTDMGTGGFTVPTCREPDFGDDGILRTQGNVAISGCMATYPTFLTARPGVSDPDATAEDLRCVADMGTGGCGFEQPLDATLKAITRSSSPVRFFRGTRGHADGANGGFIRDDSLLAVVLLTSEEDCSVADPELFNPSSATYSGNLNLRCFMYPRAVHPVERYVNGFIDVRTDRPEHLVYAAIVGVPTDLVADPARIDYDVILADERMQERVDPVDPNRLVASCNVPGRGLAFPPRRLVDVARGLSDRGAGTVVQSICQEDLTLPVEAITALIGRHACSRFLE